MQRPEHRCYVAAANRSVANAPDQGTIIELLGPLYTYTVRSVGATVGGCWQAATEGDVVIQPSSQSTVAGGRETAASNLATR